MKNKKIYSKNMKNLIFGKRTIFTILEQTPENIKKIFLLKNDKLISLFKKRKIIVEIWEEHEFDNKFLNLNHQKIAAEIKQFNYKKFNIFLDNFNESNKKNLILILDHIQDSFNFGAIIRTAVATDVDAIIVPNIKQSLVTNLVIKATVGNIFKIPIISVSNLNDTIKKLKANNFWIFSTEMIDAKDYRYINYSNINIALIIGNEHKGISPLLIKNSDFIIKLPMKYIESLNVSVATAIILYGIRDKQNFW